MVKTFLQLLLVFLLCFELSWGADQSKDAQFSREELIRQSKSLNKDTAELTIKGKILTAEPIYLSLDTIMRLPAQTFETTNHRTGLKESFTGVNFIYLLKLVGYDEPAQKIEVIAINGYRISILLSDLEQFEYLLSYKLDNKLYSEYTQKKNKGPIAIAINFDKHPELDWDIYKHQLVWFANTIIVE